MDKVPWYHFWDWNSGLSGGLLFIAVGSTWVLIIVALIKYIKG